jgi:hypothetical protein
MLAEQGDGLWSHGRARVRRVHRASDATAKAESLRDSAKICRRLCHIKSWTVRVRVQVAQRRDDQRPIRAHSIQQRVDHRVRTALDVADGGEGRVDQQRTALPDTRLLQILREPAARCRRTLARRPGSRHRNQQRNVPQHRAARARACAGACAHTGCGLLSRLLSSRTRCARLD